MFCGPGCRKVVVDGCQETILDGCQETIRPAAYGTTRQAPGLSCQWCQPNSSRKEARATEPMGRPGPPAHVMEGGTADNQHRRPTLNEYRTKETNKAAILLPTLKGERR